MKITSLIENTTERSDVKTEHGLSLYIETEQHKILFDMGQTELFSENARTLGIDLAEVDIALLSHGHYDHGGGLRRFLEINNRAPVYVNCRAFGRYYNGTEKYIGLDYRLKDHPQILYTDGEYRIDGTLSLFSCNERERKYELGDFGLTESVGGGFIPDGFLHEQYLLIKENGKEVLISGCSHKGALNIAEWFTPDVFVGGFHFSKLPTDRALAQYAEVLARLKTEYYTCHCTGKEQFEFMKKIMPTLYYLPCGKTVVI